MTSALEPINGKLERAHETVVTLQSEISALFRERKHPVICNDDIKLIFDEAQYQFGKKVPVRFSVLAGEVIHHFRSCFDHIAWQLADPAVKCEHPTRIEFPVCLDVADKDKAARYQRAIKLFPSASARRLIDNVQPYQALKVGQEPRKWRLWILHRLDSMCKHRTLPLAFTGFDFGSPALNALALRYGSDPSFEPPIEVIRQAQEEMNVTPIIVLDEFHEGKAEPLIPGLEQLGAFTREWVSMFEEELLK
jgi:hypothetical protein